MTLLIVILGSLLGALLFIGGFLMGMWLTRHNERIIEKPVVNIVEKPVYRDIITPAQPDKPKQAATQVRYAPDTAASKEQRQEADALNNLLSDNPEM